MTKSSSPLPDPDSYSYSCGLGNMSMPAADAFFSFAVAAAPSSILTPPHANKGANCCVAVSNLLKLTPQTPDARQGAADGDGVGGHGAELCASDSCSDEGDDDDDDGDDLEVN